MNHLTSKIERIRQDIQHGGKMGQVSALRLIDVINQMADEIANLRDHIKPEPRE